MLPNLKQYWLNFYQHHQTKLEKNYPGLKKDRFLREVRDLIGTLSGLKNVEMEQEISSSFKTHFKFLENSFLAGVPFAYLLQEVDFYFQKFYVDARVLIPRPETEYLLELISREASSFKKPFRRVLDVGVGSGVILLSLLKASVADEGVGVDLSTEALEVAKINTSRMKLESRVSLLHSDRLTKVSGLFDLIVTNPPYIKSKSHRSLVHQQVLNFEPHMALFIEDELYQNWFLFLFQQVKKHLAGVFFLEGHEFELSDLAKILKDLGFKNIQILQDLSGTPRYLKAYSYQENHSDE